VHIHQIPVYEFLEKTGKSPFFIIELPKEPVNVYFQEQEIKLSMSDLKKRF